MSPDTISTKDLMEKTHQLPINVIIKERRLRWLGHVARRPDNTVVTSSSYEGIRTRVAWTALWHLDALCYEGCEGHWAANRLPQPRMELAYLGRNC